MKAVRVAVVAGLFLATPIAAADVVDATAGGFTISNETVVDAERAAAWSAAVGEVDKWWSPDHTVSGDAGRLSIEMRPLGCFCEDLGDGAGVVHLTVTMVNPEVVLRLTGGLGPLGLMGVDGNMTWEFDDVEDPQQGTRIKFTYAVGGYRPEGLDGIAKPVDTVINDALLRLKSYIETGDPNHRGHE